MKKKRRMEADLTADEEQSRRTQLKDQFVTAYFDDAVTYVHSKRQLETAVSCEPNAATTQIYLETNCQKRQKVPSEGTAEAAQEETSRPKCSSTNTCNVSDKNPVASVVSGQPEYDLLHGGFTRLCYELTTSSWPPPQKK